jgi:hypothetical protein
MKRWRNSVRLKECKMNKKMLLVLSTAIILMGATGAQAAGRTEAINSCKSAIDTEVGSDDVYKHLYRIKDKGSKVLLSFKIRYEADGEKQSQVAKCLAHDSGEVLDLTIK